MRRAQSSGRRCTLPRYGWRGTLPPVAVLSSDQNWKSCKTARAMSGLASWCDLGVSLRSSVEVPETLQKSIPCSREFAGARQSIGNLFRQRPFPHCL